MQMKCGHRVKYISIISKIISMTYALAATYRREVLSRRMACSLGS
jgi:hypothetical protein